MRKSTYEAESGALTLPAVRVSKYRDPIYSFIAVAFWSLLGADSFGFMINPQRGFTTDVGRRWSWSCSSPG